MVHDRTRIGFAEDDAGGVEIGERGIPGLVEPAVREACQFGHEGARISAIRIEFLTLGDRVEDAMKRRGIGAGSGNPLPVERVVGGIGRPWEKARRTRSCVIVVRPWSKPDR